MVNVVDLMKLESASENPHGLNDADYDSLFTKDKHIIFTFHGYPWLVHRLPIAGPTATCTSAATRKGRDHDGLRHAGRERHGSVPPGDGRNRSPAAEWGPRGTI